MAMTVSAPLVTALTENGRVVYLYRGDVVPKDVTKDSLDNLKSLGFVTSDDVDPAPVLPGADDEAGDAKPSRRSTSK